MSPNAVQPHSCVSVNSRVAERCRQNTQRESEILAKIKFMAIKNVKIIVHE
jgi:hypothetical protein